MKILILGGTAEARQLAGLLVARGHDVTTALAGRTPEPARPEGALRIGGFGGPAGLAAYLAAEGFTQVVDATHPYAARISANAVAAAAETCIDLLRLVRPAWTAAPDEAWQTAQDAMAAARLLPEGARVLLTTGHADLETYLARSDCRFFVRVIAPPAGTLPGHAELIVTRPPYGLAAEKDLLARHGITHLVSKNSGGGQVAAKLTAAAELGISVIMLARPVYEPAREVASVAAALAALSGA